MRRAPLACMLALAILGSGVASWNARAAAAGARNTTVVSTPPSTLAALVDTRTWTSGGGNTFTGADEPYGMMQWAPDTSPHRAAGGGYTYADTRLFGYSLTHVSGPGCSAAGDVPVLPLTGAFPAGSAVTAATSSFSHVGETAQAGYYRAASTLGGTVVTALTATPHTGMARFTYPATPHAGLLIKLNGSEGGDRAARVRLRGSREIAGSVTGGDFCGRGNRYTVYFDITFSSPFSRSRVVGPASKPAALELTFNTEKVRTLLAKAGISYVSEADARLNWRAENPGWNFNAVKAAAQARWNALLGKIAVSGGTFAKTQEFYSLLYKDLLQPNVTSDVNGQYLGADNKVHALAAGQQAQYGMYSGWDIYHSLSQLQALLSPRQASDMVTSQLNYYAQGGHLQQWGYLNSDVYAMIGDPAAAIIADIYAFGGRSFSTRLALKDMLAQADSVNTVRPGEALEARYGYLPENASYGCCDTHSYVSSLLEYDNADFALAQFAAALGDRSDAGRLEARADNWANVFDSANGLLNPRLLDGAFVPGVTPTSASYYAEGSAYEYLWDVPNDYAGLFSRLGGNAAVAPELRKYLSEPAGQGMYALFTDEFDLGEQYAPDYAADPAGAQQAVNAIRWTQYLPGPYGLGGASGRDETGNDDLGGISSQFIWEMLGFYPENPGSGLLVFSSPGFPHAAVKLADGHTITIDAPGASQSVYYVHGLTINGAAYQKLYTTLGALEGGATLDFTLAATPGTWGTTINDVPPSYGPVYRAGAAGLVSGPGAEDRPADLGAPGPFLLRIQPADEVVLPDGAVHPQGVLGNVGGKRPVGAVNVVVRPGVHDDREFGGGDDLGNDPADERDLGRDGHEHGRFSLLLREQPGGVAAASGSGR
jgi:predicted alpha-1,2-mannosidase